MPQTSSDYDHAAQLLLESILRGDKEVGNRKQLGAMVPIQLFQALRLIGMGTSIEAMVGEGSRALVYQSGQRVGHVLGKAVLPKSDKDLKKYMTLIRGVCLQLTIGQLVEEKVNLSEGKLTLRVDECVSCAGIRGTQLPICHFEAGLVGGVVRAFVDREVRAVETRCNARGDNTCGIDVQILGG
jgi:hypothetical protein